MSSNITTILEPSEEIKWQGSVSHKVLFFNFLVSILVLFLFLGFLASSKIQKQQRAYPQEKDSYQFIRPTRDKSQRK